MIPIDPSVFDPSPPVPGTPVAYGPTSEDVARDQLHQTYRDVEGVLVPSTTTVIDRTWGRNKEYLLDWTRKVASQGGDPILIRDRAGRIGTLAHAMIEDHLLGRPTDMSDSSASDIKAAQTAFAAWLTWKASHELEPLHLEMRLAHETLKYGGTVDFLGRLDGRRALLDWKTSSRMNLEHIVQVSAYEKLLPEPVEEVWIVRADKKTGLPEPHQISVSQRAWGWAVFQHLLALDELQRETEGE